MRNKRLSIVLLAMAALLFLPLAANADEFWFFFGNQAPFNDPPPTTPAISVGTVGELINVTNANSKTITLQAFDLGSPGTGNFGQLTGRNLGTGSDEQGAGFPGATFHVSLEVRRGVFTRKENVALADGLIT